MIRKTLSAFSCFLILAAFLFVPFSVSAAQNPAHGTITIDTVNAAVGDTVIVPIRIKNNPGIMAITVSVTYDSTALAYENYIRGYLKDYTVADHATKNLIRFVNCEKEDRNDDGIMVSLQFRVKETASFDLHPISIDYKPGDFVNWNLKKFEPVIVSGGVNVAFNGSNCRHQQYGGWKTVADPGCLTPGKKQRNCVKCGHADITNIPAVGHTFEENWTVDREATKEQSGVMSRHCVRCDEKTDILTFALAQTQDDKIPNKENKEVQKNGLIEELIKEQLPEEPDGSDASATDKTGSDTSSKDRNGSETASDDPDGNGVTSGTASGSNGDGKDGQDDQTKNSSPDGSDPQNSGDLSPHEALFALITDTRKFLIGAFAVLYLLLRVAVL